jgi:hypothetical protein
MWQTIGSTAFPQDVDGGWTFRRRQVIDEAAGVCTRCGFAGADTAVRGWDAAGGVVPAGRVDRVRGWVSG